MVEVTVVGAVVVTVLVVNAVVGTVVVTVLVETTVVGAVVVTVLVETTVVGTVDVTVLVENSVVVAPLSFDGVKGLSGPADAACAVVIIRTSPMAAAMRPAKSRTSRPV
ncbi:MAG: hypothetical protein BGO26_17050 [Actinobacteria bacterium 69-20]|nr:hypothetical protein [Actinomycetota bacterium]OJV27161.1 MAG: hypothetical protein BGO26_17050 [Actinobacteria bacterium 69-20]